jgi:hypothetical protein
MQVSDCFEGNGMGRFVAGAGRSQMTLFPDCLDDWIDEDNSVRVVDVFVDGVDLGELGFDGIVPEVTGRPIIRRSCSSCISKAI